MRKLGVAVTDFKRERKALEKRILDLIKENDELKRKIQDTDYLQGIIRKRNDTIDAKNKVIELLSNQRAALVSFVTWSELFLHDATNTPPR